jgi:hypothetical protein
VVDGARPLALITPEKSLSAARKIDDVVLNFSTIACRFAVVVMGELIGCIMAVWANKTSRSGTKRAKGRKKKKKRKET